MQEPWDLWLLPDLVKHGSLAFASLSVQPCGELVGLWLILNGRLHGFFSTKAMFPAALTGSSTKCPITTSVTGAASRRG